MGDNSNKIILDLCGGTGSWSRPYKDAGYDVRNITLPDYDVRTFELPQEPIYGILAAPPCTMFSDARTNAKTPRDLIGGMDIVYACLNLIWQAQFRIESDQQKLSPLKFWALENPWYGRLKWFLGKPVYEFNPWEFGDAYKKRTALWGYFNEPIKTHLTISDVMTKKQIELHKTNSQKLPKFDKLLMPELKELKGVNNSDYWKQTKLRQTLRAITPRGFAEAFFKANQ
jgi:hypothetical protein